MAMGMKKPAKNYKKYTRRYFIVKDLLLNLMFLMIISGF
jgi:hypothetical protein